MRTQEEIDNAIRMIKAIAEKTESQSLLTKNVDEKLQLLTKAIDLQQKALVLYWVLGVKDTL